ncbi:MAG TPA: UDP-N-acetylmuramyl-tripeptide synthetase, partial [Clostridia bacterium]|nr:UDP-N-acetylmuramyl-tripeptide synthetase [Clostridia bacterium]
MLHRDLAAVLESGGLLKGVNLARSGREKVSAIENDSRKISPGSVFVAIEGYEMDGHEYIGQAVKGGAFSVVASGQVNVSADVSVFFVKNTRRALALLAAHFYGYPSKKMTLVGVTGTNGKTTTTHLIDSIYRVAGIRTGLIGTIHNKIGERELAVRHTTPESLDLQRLLRDMHDDGVRCASIEVSSHALALERVYGCEFDVAVFTNLTQDHLDFHGNMHDYLEAKTKLFLQAKRAVINADDPAGSVLEKKSPGDIYTYGLKAPAFFRATGIEVKPGGVSFSIAWQGKTATVNLKLTGLFNVYNALAAFSVGVVQGIKTSIII